MAEKHITHPFIIKLKDCEEFLNLTSFNNKYFVAVKKNDNKYLYLTIDAYMNMSNNELYNLDDSSDYVYGVDYIYSESLRNNVPLDIDARNLEILIYVDWAIKKLDKYKTHEFKYSNNKISVNEYLGSESIDTIKMNFDLLIELINENENFKFSVIYGDKELEYSNNCFEELLDNAILTQRNMVNKNFKFVVDSNDEYECKIEFDLAFNQLWNIEGTSMVNDITDVMNKFIKSAKYENIDTTIVDYRIKFSLYDRKALVYESTMRILVDMIKLIFDLDYDNIISIYSNDVSITCVETEDYLHPIMVLFDQIIGKQNATQKDLLNSTLTMSISSKDNDKVINYVIDISQEWYKTEKKDQLVEFVENVITTLIIGENNGVEYYNVKIDEFDIELNHLKLDAYINTTTGTGLVKAFRMIVAGSTTIPNENDQNNITLSCNGLECKFVSSSLTDSHVSYVQLELGRFIFGITLLANPTQGDLVGLVMNMNIKTNTDDVSLDYTIHINNGVIKVLTDEVNKILTNGIVDNSEEYIYKYISYANDNLNVLDITIYDPKDLFTNSLLNKIEKTLLDISNENKVFICDEDRNILINESNAKNQILNVILNKVNKNNILLQDLIYYSFDFIVQHDDLTSLRYTTNFVKSWNVEYQLQLLIDEWFNKNIKGNYHKPNADGKLLNVILNNFNEEIRPELFNQLIKLIKLLVVGSSNYTSDIISNIVYVSYDNYTYEFNNANDVLVKGLLNNIFDDFGITIFRDLINKQFKFTIKSRQNDFEDLIYYINFKKGYITNEDIYNLYVLEVCEDIYKFNAELYQYNLKLLDNNIIHINVYNDKSDINTAYINLITYMAMYDHSFLPLVSLSNLGMNINIDNNIYHIMVNECTACIKERAQASFKNLKQQYSSIYDNPITIHIFNDDQSLNDKYKVIFIDKTPDNNLLTDLSGNIVDLSGNIYPQSGVIITQSGIINVNTSGLISPNQSGIIINLSGDIIIPPYKENSGVIVTPSGNIIIPVSTGNILVFSGSIEPTYTGTISTISGNIIYPTYSGVIPSTGHIYSGNIINPTSGNINTSGNIPQQPTTGCIYTSGSIYTSGGIYTTGKVNTSGGIYISGTVHISGGIYISGSIYTSGNVNTSGSIYTSGNIYTSGGIYISGAINTSGGIYISGTVHISGGIYISGSIYTSGNIDIKPALPKRKEQWLPDYLIDDEYVNSLYFDEDATFNSNKQVIEFYMKLNNYNESDFTDEQLASFCGTFCKTILDLTLIEEIDELSMKDKAYKMALNFFANEGIDDILLAFNMLSNIQTITDTKTCTTGTQCSNIQYINQTTTTTCDCANQYKNYLLTLLKDMLGDVEFYKNWFSTMNEGEYNIDLIDKLIKLIDLFSTQGYDLSFSNEVIKDCPAISNSKSNCNYNLLENYKNVLEWVKNGEFKQNTNKIKSIGQQFGSILPNMLF